jgi:VWFA-related protein
MTMRHAAILLASLIVTAVAAAQVKETIRVDLIEVPVTVVDKAGDPVRGLTAANFKLYDDGKEREVSAFDVIDLAAKTQSALETINPAARRNFLLLFDLSFTSPRSLANAQSAATSFVKKSVLPRDRVAVGTLDLEHGFRLLTTFTSDRELVAGAIANPAGFRSGDPLQLSNESKVAVLDTSDAITANTLGTMPAGSADGQEARKARMERMALTADEADQLTRQMKHSNDAYLRARVEKEVDFLGALARTLRAVPGRKQLIFLSEGFDGSVISGRDARAHDDIKRENEQAMRNEAYRVDNDVRYGNSTSQKFLTEMAKFFRGSDVVLHAIDIQGLRVQNSSEGSTINSNAGLAVLAAPTGGMFFQNANDLSLDFQKMLHAQEVVYVISFQAVSQKAGQFHDLRLKLVKVPGTPQLSYRSGYWEGGNETRDERTLTAAEIILNDIPQDGLKLDAFAMAFPTATSHAQVPVVLEIPGGDIIGAARSGNPPVEIYLYAFDENGTVRDRIFQRVTLDFSKLKERLFDAGLKFVATLSLPPGKYAIRSLVRMPESERKGFVRSDLVVPERGAMAMLPPVFIDANANWVTIKGTTHAEQARYPFHLDETEFVPAATARIRSGETPQFAVFVQNATPDEITIDTIPRARFIGAAHGEGTSAFLMQLDELAPSVATVDVTLHKKGTDGVQRASVRVEP